MGPSKEEAYKDADKVFEEIWKLLQKRGIHDYDRLQLLSKYPKWEGFFYNDWKKSKVRLRNALRKLYWSEACQSF